MSASIVTVFGGTGFLGRRIVRRLRDHGFSVRVASRHPNRARALFDLTDPQIEAVEADIGEAGSIAPALAGAQAAVNAVSLYVERGGVTFHAIHVEGARNLAAEARKAGVERLAHVSGIGSDAGSTSLYIRKRGEGETAVRSAFDGAILIRPAVMFGPDDAFLTAILRLLRQLPIYPLFGDGATRLQPAYVDDVAEAIARVLKKPEMRAVTLECGGPRVYFYRDLVSAVAAAADLRPRFVPVPFSIWRLVARFSELLPNPPLTLNQVELMRIDNVVSPRAPGFADIGLSPHGLEEIARQAAISSR